jgi:hypothetical protein
VRSTDPSGSSTSLSSPTIQTFADSGEDWNMYDLRALTDTLAEAKSNLKPENRAFFESTVEVQVRQVLAAMTSSRQAFANRENSTLPNGDASVLHPT